jgi:hypothetical protein
MSGVRSMDGTWAVGEYHEAYSPTWYTRFLAGKTNTRHRSRCHRLKTYRSRSRMSPDKRRWAQAWERVRV